MKPHTESNAASDLQALVADICKEGSHLLPNFVDLLDSAVEKTFELSRGIGAENKSTNSALENAAVLLWNKTVVMKTKGVLANMTIAKLRHVAFKMVTFSCSSTNDEMSLRKQILMGMKTSRAWIDCQNFDYAEKVLDLVNQMTQTLHVMVVERINQSGCSNEDRLAVEEDMLKIVCCRAEVFSGQGRHDDALQCIQMAKEFLPKFPKEVGYVSMLCYNFGVSCYHEKQYQVCTVWLKESFDLGKERSSVPAKNQARTLRLLASAYLEWNEPGCCEKALNAVTLANTEYLHPAGLFLKLRIMLKSQENPAALKSVVEELMKHVDTGVELCHSVILLLQQHSTEVGSCPLPSSSLNRFRNLPEYGRLLIAYLDLLLRTDAHTAKAFAKECIIAHNTDCPMDGDTKKQFHVLFWEQAALDFEEKQFSDALDWYNYSLSLFRSAGRDGGCVGEGNLAKLHRNRANCYISLQQLSKAKEALSEAKEADPTSVHTHFLLYKLALLESDTEAAKASLQAMVENQSVQSADDNNSLICLAAQIAMEQKRESLAAIALSSVVTHMTDNKQVLRALRCLVRLSSAHLEDLGQEAARQTRGELLCHIRTASNKLLVWSDTEDCDRGRLRTEAAWFMKIAWNLALKCEDDPATMKEFFMLSYRLISLCGEDGGSLTHKKTCVLMATAACVQLARTAPSESDMKSLLEEALHYISEHKSMDNRLLDGEASEKTRRPAQTLMLLYEFEALTKLGDSKAESVLERALVLPSPEPKLFESFAALAVDPPARQNKLSMRALKVAIHTHLQCQEPDFVKCSKDIRQLVEQSLRCNEEEAFTYFKETADILDNKAQGRYPQMETVWLMTKSWNTGIRHFCCGSYAEAERWCAMSMRVLPHVGSLKDTYEDQMMSVYTEILEGMERQRSTQSLEE
ncbi:testis-expressed protein 11-like [Littorina saxatilis]